jgi:pentatricopeptide repeat protein
MHAGGIILALYVNINILGSGCSRTRNPEGNLAAAVEIYEDAKKAKLYLRESSYAALIRCYCKLGDEDRALALYREVQATGQTLKHRALSPLLEVLAFKNKSELCFGLYHEMLHKYELIPLERDYARFIYTPKLHPSTTISSS